MIFARGQATYCREGGKSNQSKIIKILKSVPEFGAESREVGMMVFEEIESAHEGGVAFLAVGLLLEELVVLLELDLVLLLLVAEEADGGLHLLGRLPHPPQVLLALLHHQFDLAELGHQLQVDVLGHVAPREGVDVHLPVDDPQQVLTQVLVYVVVLAVEDVQLPLVPLEFGFQLVVNLLLELVQLLPEGGQDLVGEGLESVLDKGDLLDLVLQLVLPPLEAIERALHLDEKHLLRLLLRLVGAAVSLDLVARVFLAAFGAEVVEEAVEAEVLAYLLVVLLAVGRPVPQVLVAPQLLVDLAVIEEVGLIGIGVLLALHQRYNNQKLILISLPQSHPQPPQQSSLEDIPFCLYPLAIYKLQSFLMQANEDKAMLVESMKKLTAHISNNLRRQADIFSSLSLPDLEKIVYNLRDANDNLRRISALLLCEMVYRNEDIKKRIAVLLKLHPCEGRICLGGFPALIAKYPIAVKNCFGLLKAPVPPNESQKFCWMINLDQKIAKIEYLEFKAYQLQSFIDPNRTIFGFTIAAPKKNDRISPLRDKNQCNLITPLRLSFNSNPFSKTTEFEKSFRLREKEKLKTEISTQRSGREKAYSFLPERPSKRHTES